MVFSRSIAIEFFSRFIDAPFYDQTRRSSAILNAAPRALTPSPPQCASSVIGFSVFSYYYLKSPLGDGRGGSRCIYSTRVAPLE